MYEDTLISDVLSFLPDWGLKREYESKPVENYEHSRLKAFLDENECDRDQLYVAKRVTVREIYQTVNYVKEWVKSYTHRRILPEDYDLYLAICKYSAGQLFLKYTYDNNQRTYGKELCDDALQIINKYILLNAYDVHYDHDREVEQPKRLKDRWYLPHRFCRDHTFDPCFHRYHEPWIEHHKPNYGKEYKKPYVIVETHKQYFEVNIKTEKYIPKKAIIRTRKLPRDCPYIPFSKWDGRI